MRKFFTQISVWLLVFVSISFILTTVIFNIVFAVVKPALVHNATADFQHPTSIKHIIYLFPNKIIFKDFVIDEKPETGKGRAFVLPAVLGKISILKSFLNRRILFSEIDIHKARGSWPLFCEFLSQNWTEIIHMIAKSPKGDVRIKLNGGRFLLNDLADSSRFLLAEGTCSVKGNVIQGEGELHFEKNQFARKRAKRVTQERLLHYQFSTEWVGDEILLRSVVMESNNIYCKLWGSLLERQLQLNGFALYNAKESREERLIVLKIPERIKSLIGKGKGPGPSIDGLEAKSIYLTDIDGIINIDFPNINIQKFSFNFNNAPGSISGSILAGDPIGLELGLTSSPSRRGKGKKGNLIRSDLTLKGMIQEDVFKGDGTLRLQFDGVKSVKGLESIDVYMKEASIAYEQYPVVIHKIKKGQGLWKMKEKEHKLSLADIVGTTNLENDNIKEMRFKAGFYGGLLEGQVKIDADRFPFQITSHMTVADAQADRMGELLEYFSKISGKSHSTMTFRNSPEMQLEGGISINNGRLQNFKFFKWLAGAFILPSLADIDFSEMRLRFFVGSDKTGLEDIVLKSKELQLTGYYLVNNHSLVSSKLSLLFGRDLLGASPKFKSILRLFPENTPYLDFNFQLSGNKNAVNFMWLPSESKAIIEKGIPDFIERSIERKIKGDLDGADPQKDKGSIPEKNL